MKQKRTVGTGWKADKSSSFSWNISKNTNKNKLGKNKLGKQ